MTDLRLDDPRLGAALAVLAAVPVLVWQWGFMVDDALISARYAHHLATGVGYRFNAGGPVTDGVTPLGWAHLLAPLAGDSVWRAYRAAKWLGALVWLVGLGTLGVALAKLGGARRRYGALLLVATSVPLGAWAAAGMETGCVMGLSAAAVALRQLARPRLAAVLLGVVAAWRPETVPFVFVLAVAQDVSGPERATSLGIALGPAVAVALTRWAIFGRVVPLAAWAKTPVPILGMRYAVAAFIVLGAGAVLWPRLPRWGRGLQVAVLVHFLAVALAGGDWMPLGRLGVVVVPAVVLVLAERLAQPGWWRWLPLALVLGAPIYTAARMGPRSAAVEGKREAIVAAARPSFAKSRVVATLDIGWVGAAHDGTIVDLAGVTDPTVAVLPGGHTSKEIPRSIIGGRDVDTIVLLAAGETAQPWFETRWSRWVEAHVAHLPEVTTSFVPVARLSPLTYVVAQRAIDRSQTDE